MKRVVFTLLAVLAMLPLCAQRGEKELNKEYEAAIREYLEQDVAGRQRTMQRRAQQMLVNLPNEYKLYDESYVTIRTEIVEGLKENGEKELNYVYDISYNCKHLEGYTDDYPLGAFAWETSNSCRAICSLTKTFVEDVLNDIFRAGKAVSVKIFSSTDGTELSRVIPYNGEYGNFRYCPTVFNGEPLRISVDSSTGIQNNCQLAYIRAQSVREFLENNVRNLARTQNDYSYVTRSYADTGAHYRRSSIELTVHDAFRETIELMTADKMQDDYVDVNIPQGTGNYDNAYVLIVANEDYDHKFLPAVPYAGNDGEVLQRYFVKTLGVPARQVKVLHNASKAQIKDEGIHWLTDLSQAVALKGGETPTPQADIYVYFAGHGFTDFDGVTYMVPNNLDVSDIKVLQDKKSKSCCKRKKKAQVDDCQAYDIALKRGEAARFAKQCIAVDTLCAWLKGKDKRNAYPVNRLTVILDASFDGHQRNGGLMVRSDRKVEAADAKKSKRKANKNSDAIVLMAAKADKTAFSYDAYHHGFLTYFLLKEVKGMASQLDSYSYQDIYEAVDRKLNKESALQGKWQELYGYVDGKHAGDWKTLKLGK